MYFQVNQLEQILNESRGWQAEVIIDKASGKERCLIGVICKGTNNRWLVNEQDLETPDFKQIPLGRVKRIKINGLILKPLKDKQ